jgi:hypothetical protein
MMPTRGVMEMIWDKSNERGDEYPTDEQGMSNFQVGSAIAFLPGKPKPGRFSLPHRNT